MWHKCLLCHDRWWWQWSGFTSVALMWYRHVTILLFSAFHRRRANQRGCGPDELESKKKKRYFCCIGISQSSHTEPANGNVCTHSTFSGPLVSSLEVTANQNGSEPSQLYKEGCLPKLTSSYLSCRRGSNFLQVTLDNMRDVSEARLFPLVC